MKRKNLILKGELLDFKRKQLLYSDLFMLYFYEEANMQHKLRMGKQLKRITLLSQEMENALILFYNQYHAVQF
jgi:hypothetical protein